MRLRPIFALIAACFGGLVALSDAPAQAAPIAAASSTAVEQAAPLQTVQYYGRSDRRPGVRRGYYGRPVVVRRGYYGRPALRRRVVCTTRVRVVRTPYGLARRPVRVCR